jgi:hypothetical protein
MSRLEDAIQCAVFDHIRVRGSRVAWHTPNGGKRNRIEAAILKGLGVYRHGGRIFTLELKAEDGRPTEAQLQLIADMEAAGAFACVLESWGLLRGRAS